jgi:hypothetical protein
MRGSGARAARCDLRTSSSLGASICCRWLGVGNEREVGLVHLDRKGKDGSVQSESSAFRATVDRLSALALASLATDETLLWRSRRAALQR